MSILSIVAGLSNITPFILNLLQGGSISTTIIGACIMQAIIRNIVMNMAYVWKGFLSVIIVNVVLLLIYYF